MRIRVSADSTCDLSPEIIAKYNIGILPLYIIFGDESRRDGIDCTREDIFAHVKETGKLCSTAAVTVGDYQDWFAQGLQNHDQVVHFTISSDMSACYQNACLAAEEFEGRVFVVDARNLSTGIGHLAINAAELAAEGKTGAEIKAILDEKKNKLNVSFVLETLTYLHKGGRCSAVAALGANILGLKPCIEVHQGKMGVGKKYRGKMEKVYEEYIRDRLLGHEDIDYKRIFVTDSGLAPGEAEKLVALIRELTPFEEILHTDAQSTICNHCGPGCMGILYYNK